MNVDDAKPPLSETPPPNAPSVDTKAPGEARPLNIDLQSAILNSPSSISHPPSSIHHPRSPGRLAHVPRLSIGFLLLWMAATAAVLPLITLTSLLGRPEQWTTLEVAIVVVGVAIFGWLLAGTLLICRHALQKTLWPLEPGERLLLEHVGLGLLVVSWVVPRNALGRPPAGSVTFMLLLFVFFFIGSMIGLAVAIWQRAGMGRMLMLIFALGVSWVVLANVLDGPPASSAAFLFLLFVVCLIASLIYLAGAIWHEAGWWRMLMLVFSLGVLVVSWVVLGNAMGGRPEEVATFLSLLFVFFLVTSLICLTGTIWQQAGWWRMLTLVFATSPLLAIPPLPVLLLFMPPVALSLLVVAVLTDRRRQTPRYWLHWSGVAFTGLCLVGLTAFELVGILWL